MLTVKYAPTEEYIQISHVKQSKKSNKYGTNSTYYKSNQNTIQK